MKLPVQRVLVALLVVASGFVGAAVTGCFAPGFIPITQSGWTYTVIYSAKSPEAESALAHAVTTKPALRAASYQRNSAGGMLVMSCPANQRYSVEFKARQKSVEDALGPALLSALSVHTETHRDF